MGLGITARAPWVLTRPTPARRGNFVAKLFGGNPHDEAGMVKAGASNESIEAEKEECGRAAVKTSTAARSQVRGLEMATGRGSGELRVAVPSLWCSGPRRLSVGKHEG